MSYTPLSSTKSDTVELTACLHSSFVNMPVYPARAGDFRNIKFNTFDDPLGTILEGYANWIEGASATSYLTDITPPGDLAAGYYTGTRLMHYTQYDGGYRVWWVDHDVSDPDSTSGPAFSHADVGDGGVTPGDQKYTLSGPSLDNGDSVSWFDGQGGEMHFLTSDGVTLTRKQAFEFDLGENYLDWLDNAYSWIADGTSIWLLVVEKNTPWDLRLVRFTPTDISDPFDYEKFSITIDDSDIESRRVSGGGGVTVGTTADTFIFEFPEASPEVGSLGGTKHLEFVKDCSTYTEYMVSAGDGDVEDFLSGKGLFLTYDGSGEPMLYTQGFGGEVGTYDLTCAGVTPPVPLGQGHVYVRNIRRSFDTSSNIDNALMPSAGDVFGVSDENADVIIWKDEN